MIHSSWEVTFTKGVNTENTLHLMKDEITLTGFVNDQEITAFLISGYCCIGKENLYPGCCLELDCSTDKVKYESCTNYGCDVKYTGTGASEIRDILTSHIGDPDVGENMESFSTVPSSASKMGRH